MTSHVLVYPPHVYQTQTSAFCSVKKPTVELNCCVFHRRTLQTYIIEVNLGIAKPANILLSFKTKVSCRPQSGQDLSLQAATSLKEVHRELLQKTDPAPPPPTPCQGKGPEKLRLEGDSSVGAGSLGFGDGGQRSSSEQGEEIEHSGGLN